MIISLLLASSADAGPPPTTRDWSIALRFMNECASNWTDLLNHAPARREVSGLGATTWVYGWAWDQGLPPVSLNLYDGNDQVTGTGTVDAFGTVTVSGDVAALTPVFLERSCTSPRFPRWFVRVDTVQGDSFLTYAY
ncbi:MAG: hypothetical protein AAF211_27040 [Myxococcota bacterium]